MRLELNTNGAWRVVLTELSRHDKASDDRFRLATDAALALSQINGETNRRPLKWRLVSENSGHVLLTCDAGGWQIHARPGAEA